MAPALASQLVLSGARLSDNGILMGIFNDKKFHSRFSNASTPLSYLRLNFSDVIVFFFPAVYLWR